MNKTSCTACILHHSLQDHSSDSTPCTLARAPISTFLVRVCRQLLQLVHDARELNTPVSQEQQPDQAQVLQQKQKDFRWSCEQAKELWRQHTQRDELLASLLQGGATTLGCVGLAHWLLCSIKGVWYLGHAWPCSAMHPSACLTDGIMHPGLSSPSRCCT
jgi:hypothetical protein